MSTTPDKITAMKEAHEEFLRIIDSHTKRCDLADTLAYANGKDRKQGLRDLGKLAESFADAFTDEERKAIQRVFIETSKKLSTKCGDQA